MLPWGAYGRGQFQSLHLFLFPKLACPRTRLLCHQPACSLLPSPFPISPAPALQKQGVVSTAGNLPMVLCTPHPPGVQGKGASARWGGLWGQGSPIQDPTMLSTHFWKRCISIRKFQYLQTITFCSLCCFRRLRTPDWITQFKIHL